MSRAVRILLPLLLLIPLALTGCSMGSNAEAGSTTLRIWYSTDDPVERAWSQDLARHFQTVHKDIHVKLIDYSFEDLNTKLQLALSGGNPPDLAYVTPRGPGIPAYVGAHQLRDLTDAARRGRWADELRPGLLADYNAPFSHYGAKPGHIVAAPMALAAVGVMVNERLLHRLRLGEPETPAQLDTALKAAKQAGYVPIGIGNGDGWLGDDWYLTLVNALVPPSSLLPEQNLDPSFTFKRPPFVQAAAILKGWSEASYFTPDFGGLDAQEGIDQFFKGKTLFQLISSSENSQIRQDAQQTHIPIAVFAFPRKNGGRVMPVSGYEGWIVPARSQHPDAAIAFMDYVLSRPAADFLLKQGVVPAHRVSVADVSSPLWLRQYIAALDSAVPGVYLDAAPIANLNGTMEANVQLLLQGYEPPTFIPKSLQEVYATHGHAGSTARIDGEF